MGKTSIIAMVGLLLCLSLVVGANDPFSQGQSPMIVDGAGGEGLFMAVYKIWPGNEIDPGVADRYPPSCLRREMGWDEMVLVRALTNDGVDFISKDGAGVFFAQTFSSKNPITLRGGPSTYLGIVQTRQGLVNVGFVIRKYYPVELVGVYSVGPGYKYMCSDSSQKFDIADDVMEAVKERSEPHKPTKAR